MQQLRVCRKRLDSKLGLVIVAHQLNGIFKTTSLMSQLFFGSFVQYAFTHRLKHQQKVKVVDLVAPFVYVFSKIALWELSVILLNRQKSSIKLMIL